MNIKYRLGILIFILINMQCVPNAAKYRLTPDSRSRTLKNVYGSFINVETDYDTIAGELLSMVEDTMFILNDQVQPVNISKIKSAELTLVTNRSRKYTTLGVITVVPALTGAMIHPEYSTEFLAFSGITAGFSLIGILAEEARKPHIISYPDEIFDIHLLSKYARFPRGFPKPINLEIFETMEPEVFDLQDPLLR